ncbi:hypothetical protein BDU57DRAFT_516695 [Ampelomyces quisqualis]|uniref:Uncharacterized protein n=1 Tax=Ampelomyces quisqualis TaxID=50730 RepID=A0A6A5QPB1_AMPQU|nr:hypothetical protein BDU57DRAFT_516695 [Ampelomyces quisqualis]
MVSSKANCPLYSLCLTKYNTVMLLLVLVYFHIKGLLCLRQLHSVFVVLSIYSEMSNPPVIWTNKIQLYNRILYYRPDIKPQNIDYIFDIMEYDPENYPVLLGVTGDACGTCSSTIVPLYDLPCHDSDEFHCRDCLTKTWYTASDEVIRCPVCDDDCGFMRLQNIIEFKGISRYFVDYEGFDMIRQQSEIQNNLIGFTDSEAAIFLRHTYEYYLDQLMYPDELGGVPSELTENAADPTVESLKRNPFFCTFVQEVLAVPKMMIAPSQLEKHFLEMLDSVTANFTRQKHGAQMRANGVDLRSDDAVLLQAKHIYSEINGIMDNWVGIIKMWVDLLAWRHIERTGPAEGGAAERFRKPLSFWPVNDDGA